MTLANSRQTSRSFVDLNLLSCVHSTDTEIELEPDEMKDVRSFTGIKSAYRVMAVSPDGQHVLFKKNNNTLYIYHTDDIMECTNIRICGIDIFDFAFLDEKEVVLVLQGVNNEYFIVKGIIDVKSKLLKIVTPVSTTHMSGMRKHYKTCLIYDESGPVLISYPISYLNKAQQKQKAEEPKIELLHLRAFYDKSGVKLLTIRPKIRDHRALLCDPFIYRNYLYLFNYFESNLLCISMSGSDKGEVRVLNTYADAKYQRPNSKYANKCHLVFGDVLLVYFYQRLDNAEAEPQLWKLELGSMNWHRLQLLLSYHSPCSRVTLQQAAGKPLAFLHGECGRNTCSEKAHLYQLNLQQECVKPTTNSFSLATPLKMVNTLVDKVSDRVKRSKSSVDLHETTPSTSACGCTKVQESTEQTPSPKQSLPPSLRYANKRHNNEKSKRSTSVVTPIRVAALSSPTTATKSSNAKRYKEEEEEEENIMQLPFKSILVPI